MKKATLLILFYSITCCSSLFSQTSLQIHPADKTRVDNSSAQAQAHMFEMCQTELKYAIKDPEAYSDAKMEKIRKLLAGENLAYWETYALTEIYKNGYIQNPLKIITATRTLTDILEIINNNFKTKDKNQKQWGFLYTIVDFVSEKFFVTDKDDYDAEQITKILTSIAVAYGEKVLDIDGNMDQKQEVSNDLLLTDNLSRSRGLAAIESLVKRTDGNLSYKALEAIAYIANSEKQRQGQSTELSNIESLNILHGLVYYNPLSGSPTLNSVVDINRGIRNETEQQQATAIMYIGMLGDNSFLNNYLNFGQNKMAKNTAAQLLGKELPHPYHGVLSTVNKAVSTLHDLAIMTAVPKVSWAEIPFSASTSEGWATSKLINPSYSNSFSDIGGLNYKINPSINGLATASLQIPKMMEFIPYVSTQWWSIPSALKNVETMKALFYIVRAIPGTAIIIDQSNMYKIDAVNNKVTKIDNIGTIDKNKAYVAISMTLSDGRTIEYLIWVETQAEAKSISEYVESSALLNEGITININTKNISPSNVEIKPEATLPYTLNPATESSINKILKTSNLNIKEQTDILNAFKSRTSLASPKVINKFIDGNTIYSNVEVFTNPNGSTVLKVVRGLSTSNGIVNFTRTFTYGLDGQVKESSYLQDLATGSKATALANEVAEDLDTKITEYNNFCKDLTPRI